MTKLNKTVRVENYDAITNKVLLKDYSNNYSFEVPEEFIRHFNVLPDEVMENDHLRVGAIINMIASTTINGKLRYTIDRSAYAPKMQVLQKAGSTSTKAQRKHMSLAHLLDGSTPYATPSINKMKSDFLKRVEDGMVDQDTYQEVMRLLYTGDETVLEARLKDVLEIFDLGSQESKGKEYKSSIYHLPVKDAPEKMEELLRQIVAFGNSGGGSIFVGVDNNGKVTGVEKELLEECPFSTRERFVDDLINRLNQRCENYSFANNVGFRWFHTITPEKHVFFEIVVPAFEGVLLYGSELLVRTATGMKLLKGREHIEYILTHASK